MRKLSAGNKLNFTIFTIIIVIILVILVGSVLMVMNADKEEYTISRLSTIYDKNYEYIELDNDAVISKKWTGNYYLKEDETGNEYELGDYAISYDSSKNRVELFGTFYQVLEGGDVSKLTEYNTVSCNGTSSFYKIDDRKYLIVGSNIANDTETITTSNYLIVIVDKLGNALLLNNEINVKTINEMIISTDDYSFNVANEVLTFSKEDDEENIDLTKILGSTNEYVQSTEQTDNTEENSESSGEEETSDGDTIISSTTTNNSSTTIIQGDTSSSSSSNSSTTQDTSWVSKLNDWISEVAAGFQSIYNGNSGSSDDSTLSKSITLNSLSSGTTYIDINYTIVDPESKYNVVYAIITDGINSYTISLDKEATTYRLTGLTPDTNYSVDIGYKIIYSDSSVEENVEDTMVVRTTSLVESLEITKVSLNYIYFELKLDSSFTYDSGATINVYLNDSSDIYQTISLTDADIEQAALSKYTGSFAIPSEYKQTGASITIKLENTYYSGSSISTGLMSKIVNY